MTKDFSHKNYPSNREMEHMPLLEQIEQGIGDLRASRAFWRTTAIVLGILAVGELILRLV